MITIMKYIVQVAMFILISVCLNYDTAIADLINLQVTPQTDSISFTWELSDCAAAYDTEITLEQKELGFSQKKAVVGTCGGCGTGTNISGLEMATQYTYSIKAVTVDGDVCEDIKDQKVLTRIGGTLEKDRKLGQSPGPGPYIVMTDLTILKGITLTLENTELQFAYASGFEHAIYVKGGTLNASSTAFTSAEQNKSAGQWDNIRVQDGGIAIIKNCIVEYGKSGIDVGSNSSLTFENSELRHVKFAGISVYGTASIYNSLINDIGRNGIYFSGSSLHLYNSTISNVVNTACYLAAYGADINISDTYFYQNGAGIYLSGDISPNLSGNYFSNSTSGEIRWAVQNNTGKPINANCCWWGDLSGPYDETCNSTGKGDKVSSCSLVDYTGCLTAFVPPSERIPCDFDYDKAVTLKDAVISLKFLAGLSVCNIFKNSDINGDGKIGSEEVIYILQIAAGIKQ